MDEPFSGLDPVNAKLLEQTLLELKDQGKAILFSTHRMDQVEKLCDSICLINQGEAVLAGSVREIKSRYERNHLIVEFEGSADFLNSAEIAEAKNFSGHAEIRLKEHGDAQKLLREASAGAPNLPIRTGRALARRDLHSDRWRQGRCVTCCLIARREYLEQVRGRAFKMTTFGVPADLRGSSSVLDISPASASARASTSQSLPLIRRWPTKFAQQMHRRQGCQGAGRRHCPGHRRRQGEP